MSHHSASDKVDELILITKILAETYFIIQT